MTGKELFRFQLMIERWTLEKNQAERRAQSSPPEPDGWICAQTWTTAIQDLRELLRVLNA